MKIRRKFARGQIRISAKNLGALALPEMCPRCFWIKLQMQNRLPYQIFPGIFSSIDSYTKNIVHSFFDNNKKAPLWMKQLGKFKGYLPPPHYSKYFIVDEAMDIMLTGSPDAILVRKDGSHVIVDYKTAKFTETQDALYPMYAVQLNGYARIGNEWGLAPITGLALLYAEPLTDEITAALAENHMDDGFSMKFVTKIVEVPVNLKLITPLLAKTRELYELNSAPPGREGCKDCEKLSEILDLCG